MIDGGACCLELISEGDNIREVTRLPCMSVGNIEFDKAAKIQSKSGDSKIRRS